jgi:hypothetical protein
LWNIGSFMHLTHILLLFMLIQYHDQFWVYLMVPFQLQSLCSNKWWMLNYLPQQSWIRPFGMFWSKFSLLHIWKNPWMGDGPIPKSLQTQKTHNNRELCESCPERVLKSRSELQWSNVMRINLFCKLILFLCFSWCNILLNTFVTY